MQPNPMQNQTIWRAGRPRPAAMPPQEKPNTEPPIQDFDPYRGIASAIP